MHSHYPWLYEWEVRMWSRVLILTLNNKHRWAPFFFFFFYWIDGTATADTPWFLPGVTVKWIEVMILVATVQSSSSIVLATPITHPISFLHDWQYLILFLFFPGFEFISFFVCLLFVFLLSFCLSEDDAYVDKLPTFERHFDSFAGIVTSILERGGKGNMDLSSASLHLT